MRSTPWPGRRSLVRRLALLMLGWLLVLLGGMLLNLRFDMIGKHLYYTIPAAAIAGGLVFAAVLLLLDAAVAPGFVALFRARHLVVEDRHQHTGQRQGAQELQQAAPGAGRGERSREGIEPFTVHSRPFSRTSR